MPLFDIRNGIPIMSGYKRHNSHFNFYTKGASANNKNSCFWNYCLQICAKGFRNTYLLHVKIKITVMYVVDTSLGSIETMKITVINSTGAYWVVDVLPEFTIDKLKLMALSHFFNPLDSIKVSDRYKLILVSQNRPLPDESTIRDEEIRENGKTSLLKYE